ncbi:MAG: YigZ family protein [Clostridia bacterium]
MYQTIKQNVSAQIIEKKSKFIAEAYYVQSVEEAEGIIEETKKRFYDARHHCYAYIVNDEKIAIQRSSDDGEPTGTAGAPILHILEKKGLMNVLVIVTRYFGGILLGTGGLVKAYSDATKQALENAEFVKEEPGYVIQLMLAYEDYKNFNYYCNKNGINCINITYDDKISMQIEVNEKEKTLIFENSSQFDFKILDYMVLKQKNIRKNIDK